jgi:sugar diacid utilization regulator
VERYRLVTEEMAATSEDRRRETVLALLEGEAGEDLAATDALLGYRMRATHVGFLVHSGDHREVSRAFTALRERTAAPASLLVQPDAGTWFGWLGYHDGVDAQRLEQLRDTASGTGLPVVIGEPGRGLDGFRRSHDSARRTAELRPALRNAPSCLCARELRLETFLLENPVSARRFIADELGGLAADTERAQRIRDTLLTWLSAGSQAKAAAELGVHENTVRMRVRCAAEELGAALSERRTELLVALRLSEALGPESADE